MRYDKEGKNSRRENEKNLEQKQVKIWISNNMKIEDEEITNKCNVFGNDFETIKNHILNMLIFTTYTKFYLW